MLPGVRGQQGALFIDTSAPSGNYTFSGGFAVKPLGVLYATTAVGTRFNGGHMTTDLGQLCIAPGGVTAGYVNGLPVTVDGRLVVQLNVAVLPSDPFVGGIRVGPNGGVYCLDTAPPKEYGFSNGFSNGFDVEAVATVMAVPPLIPQAVPQLVIRPRGRSKKK